MTWRSKKQVVVAQSSSQAIAHSLCEGIWLRRVMTKLRIGLMIPMKLYYDNKTAISISHYPIHHNGSKYVKVDRHFIREKIEDGSLYMTYIPIKK